MKPGSLRVVLRLQEGGGLLLAPLAAPLLLLAPVWAAGQALFWGTSSLQFVPWWWQAWQALRQGGLPLWNPWLGMGAPLLANYQSGLLYPPDWAYLLPAWVGGIGALAWGQALLLGLHLAWAGLGMAYLARRLELGALAQAVSGLAFGLSTYLVSRGSFLSIPSAAAWTPWVLAFALPGQPVYRLALVLGLQLLAGHAQTSWYTGMLVGAWAVYWGWRERNLGRGLVRLALAALWAAGLAAVQLLPTAEYLLQSQRAAAVDYEFAMTYSLWPWRLLTFFLPNLFGSPALGSYWGYAAFWEDAAYIGLLPLLMALAALRRRRGGNSLALFLWGVILVSILLALGKNTPLFPWLYAHIPTFAMFQAPARFLLWAVTALALLAGLGVDGWRRPRGRGLYWTRLGTAGALAVVFGAGIAWLALGKVSPTFFPAFAWLGALGMGCGLLSLAAPQAGGRASSVQGPAAEAAPGTGWQDRASAYLSSAAWQERGWPWGVTLFVALDLLAAGWGLNPGIDLGFYTQTPSCAAPVQRSLDGSRLVISRAAERSLKYDRFMTFNSFQIEENWENLREVLVPDLSLVDRVASANNFDPLVPGRYARWMEALESAQGAARRGMLQRMAVGLEEVLDGGAPQGVRFEAVSGGGRFRWTPCARRAATAEQALEMAAGGQLDPARWVVLETEQELPPCGQGQGEILVAGEGGDGQELLLQVGADAPGWLVIADTWYPGWKAWMDGRPVEVLHADYLFRAIPLPAGEHTVRLAYFPWTLAAGLAASLAAWGAWLAVWSWKRRTQGRAARMGG
jgi:hypothetical protein